ncbi:hypothetical protein IFM89_001409 [Coptis chinensis]|uniref:Uncharacterized protein n=1 Tax=Coptis chinensis TaxID=261450 RepID=A0A835I9A5_9MAGN|nr:hypothetical protein IFM89_001409 [Coptis chinensis]
MQLHEEFINGITDVGGVCGNRRQPALLRLALDDVVIIYLYWFLGAVVVIAANAGGAWTPIGDVTTIMLWIHGQISTLPTMKDLFIPSFVSLAVPLALMSFTSEVDGKGRDSTSVLASEQMAPRGQLVFAVGIGALLFVPVFKAITGLPPYMGILLGLGVLWILTDAIHYGESERQRLKVPQALSRIDTQGALFFLGILLSVCSLEAAGLLRELANYLDAHIPNVELIASVIGVFLPSHHDFHLPVWFHVAFALLWKFDDFPPFMVLIIAICVMC